ncbi:MAG: hypothetical protein V2A56_13170 [bacterium]
MIAAILIVFSSCGFLNSNSDGEDGGYAAYEEILLLRYTPSEIQICAIRPYGQDLRIICSFKITEITPSNFESYVTAKWSPDKRYIALIGGPGSTLEYYPIWLLTSSGSFLRKLTWNALDVIWYDNETIYYTRAKGYFSVQYDLYRMNIHDMEERMVYSQTDSTNIYFNSFFDQNNWLSTEMIYGVDISGTQTHEYGEIMEFNIDNKERNYLLHNEEMIEWNPILSPNKNIVVYRARYDTSWAASNLYWFSMEDRIPHHLTFYSSYNQYQNYKYAWGPNSDKIAVSNPGPVIEGLKYKCLDVSIIDLQTGLVDTLTHTAQDSISSFVLDWR